MNDDMSIKEWFENMAQMVELYKEKAFGLFGEDATVVVSPEGTKTIEIPKNQHIHIDGKVLADKANTAYVAYYYTKTGETTSPIKLQYEPSINAWQEVGDSYSPIVIANTYVGKDEEGVFCHTDHSNEDRVYYMAHQDIQVVIAWGIGVRAALVTIGNMCKVDG